MQPLGFRYALLHYEALNLCNFEELFQFILEMIRAIKRKIIHLSVNPKGALHVRYS